MATETATEADPGVRAAVEAAFSARGETAAEAQEAPAEESADATPAPVVAESITTEAPSDAKSTSERARDATGKYTKPSKTQAPKPGTASQAAPDLAGKATATAPPVNGTQTASRPPQSWRPGERESWAAIPKAAQDAISRVDREIRQTMQEAAQAKQFQQGWQQTLGQYAPLIGNADPQTAVRSLLQTAHVLAYSPGPQKAQLLAHLVKSYGVPIDALAAALDGQAPQQGQQQQIDPNQLRQQLKQELMQDFAQQRMQGSVQRASAELEQFAAEHEFLEDVRDTMADMLEVSAKRGIPLSYEDAYNRACRLDPDITQTLGQREKAAQLPNARASTARASRASSSVRSTPVNSIKSTEEPQDWGSALRAAMNAGSTR